MAGGTLLEIARRRFGVDIDADSEGAHVLASFTPRPDFVDGATTGTADGSLTFALTPEGVALRASASDLFVFDIPVGSFGFTLVPAGPGHGAPTVEIVLVALQVPLPFLRAAARNAAGLLEEAAGSVALDFPDLLLLVTVNATTIATATLAPSHNAAGALEIAMSPPFALVGPGTVLGFEFERGSLLLDGPGEPEIRVPTLQVYVAPPGIPPLALRGEGRDLTVGLGTTNGGLSGDFELATAGGARAAQRPRFLRDITARVRLRRGVVTLLELTGQIELTGEVEAQLGDALPDVPGLLDYRLGLALEQGWRASLRITAAGGRAYLWRTQRTNPAEHDLPLDTLGAYAVFAPLLVSSLPESSAGGYVDLALAAGAAGGLAASRWISPRSLTLNGGELIVSDRPGGPQAFLFFDLETEVDVDVRLGDERLIATRRPLKVGQKAIGLRLDFGGGATPALQPVFDRDRGFALDLSDPGTFEIPGILGELLQPAAARTARENPINLEVDLITKADLGVVTVDRATVRVPLVGGGQPTLTGLGAHVHAGTVEGGGYLTVLRDGVAGGFDVALAPPLGIRARADLSLGRAHDAATGEDLTSVLAAFSIEWPVPIPLANSGGGLFGVVGLFAMHKERDEGPEGALEWLAHAPDGDPARGVWRGAAHRWALGLGAVIGTVEGGFLVHAKGMLLLELPGPRLLLIMKADLLKPRPPTKGAKTGSLLAIIEIRRDSLTIGVVANYEVPFLLKVQVPVEAFFDFDRPEQWHLDIGAIPESTPPKLPASVKFMSTIRADGYVMIHGDGIPEFPLRPLQGFSVAAGIRAALTWGPEAIGLYIRVGARADVAISFKPFVVIGKVTLEGELHLFIVSIGASASAELTIADGTFFVRAEVCGEVDFFFFSVEGCVTLKLGDERVHPADADLLVRAASLHSRSPALLPGSGTDRPVDGSLGNAFHLDGSGQFVGDEPNADMPVVPIDAIPVLELEMRPHTDGACRFLTQSIPSLLDATSWVRRGERFYRYTLRRIELSGVDANGVPLASPVDNGETPAVWWDRRPHPAAGDDTDVQLALLDWIPHPTPVAAERTVTRDEEVKRRWGDVCAEVAPPAGVLWSLTGVAAGPSPRGWKLRGTFAPDKQDTVRSTPPNDLLTVTEGWRSGDPIMDALVAVEPAFVLASDVRRERLLAAPRNGRALAPRIENDDRFDEILHAHRPRPTDLLPDGLLLDIGGLRRLRGLVFLQPEIGHLVVRGLDAVGRVVWEQTIDSSNSRDVGSLSDLPSDWTTTAAWAATVRGVIDAWFDVYFEWLGAPRLIYFEVDTDDAIVAEVGLQEDVDHARPRWGVLLVEALSTAEFARFAFDNERRTTRIAVVDGALGADQANRALLRPGVTYTVAVTYDVVATGVDEAGQPAAGATPVAPAAQQFRFKTDANPPSRIDPWVMATAPADGEASFFYGDPLRIVFATNATRRLFKAYGRDLFAVVRAASGTHPPPSVGHDPAEVPLDGTIVYPEALIPFVFTPFAGALHDAIEGQSCIDVEGREVAHERVTLTMHLEPLTEYILDLKAEPALGDAAYPPFRRSFATSRYPNFEAFAADVDGTDVTHRLLSNAAAAPLEALAAGSPGPRVRTVSDVEFERALRDASWGDIKRPSAPRLTMIWQGDAGAAVPLALFVETTESPWRMRGVPELVTDAHGVQRYRLVPRTWLELVEMGTASPRVARFVRSTDGSRTLAFVVPGFTAGSLELALQRTPHALFEGAGEAAAARLAFIDLTHSPWGP